MKTTLTCAVCVLCGVGVAAQSTPMLTLEQAVQEALARNDQILNQHDATEQATLGVRLARNTFQPKVTPNVLGSFGQTNVNSQNYRVDVSQKFVSGTEIRFGTGTSTAQIPGVARRALSSAELRRADADRQQALAEQQVALEVASGYYRIVAQQTLVEAARQ